MQKFLIVFELSRFIGNFVEIRILCVDSSPFLISYSGLNSIVVIMKKCLNLHYSMTSVFFISLLSVLLFMPTVADGQVVTQNSIQCGYHFLRKGSPDSSPSKYLNMRLDYVDGVSMFYDGFTYERDSLRILAFGEDGKIKDQEEYNKLRSLPRQRVDDFTIVNFKTSEIIQLFRQATITIRGTTKMSVPDWKLSEESSIINGFSCKKATANYLGRNWIVWYTEDIPLPIGPWMLWGTPGLIVSAQDSEGLFSFQLIWADKLDNYNRVTFIDSLYPDKPFQKGANTKHFVLSMKEAEKMYTRLRTDVSYLFEVTGVRSNNVEGLQKKAKKYIPLIPSDYWKDK